jgi:hypothetical protein
MRRVSVFIGRHQILAAYRTMRSISAIHRDFVKLLAHRGTCAASYDGADIVELDRLADVEFP